MSDKEQAIKDWQVWNLLWPFAWTDSKVPLRFPGNKVTNAHGGLTPALKAGS